MGSSAIQAWRATPIRAIFKAPAQLDASMPFDVRTVCADAFNLAVLQRLVAIIDCTDE